VKTHNDKRKGNKNHINNGSTLSTQNSDTSTFQFKDNRPEATTHVKLREMANDFSAEEQLVQKKVDGVIQREVEVNINHNKETDPVKIKAWLNKWGYNMVVERLRWFLEYYDDIFEDTREGAMQFYKKLLIHEYEKPYEDATIDVKLKRQAPDHLKTLYFYCDKGLMDMVISTTKTLRASAGAKIAENKRNHIPSRGYFPPGIYGTTLKPDDDKVTKEQAAIAFYGPDYAKTKLAQNGLDYYIEFNASLTDWKKTGELRLPGTQGIWHWVKEVETGKFESIVIISHGESALK